MAANFQFSVFTKPWRMPLADLARHVRHLGFEAVELPVRPGFQVEPARVATDLPLAARVLADSGVRIASIAAAVEEPIVAACAEAGIPVLRIMVPIEADGYMATEARTRRRLDGWLPLLERYGVTVGIQNHCDRFVCHAMGLRRLLEGYDPRYVAAIWDAAHNALNGEDPEMALDIIWPHLCMVNLKNAYWRRTSGPEAEQAAWEAYWTSGRHGLASWPRVAAELTRRSYAGTICLPAEYADEPAVDRLIVEDLAYARSLFGALHG